MARVVTVNDVLDGHVVLDIECLDRIYLNAYVPILQTSSQVVAFLSGHLGFPFPSPALFRQLGDRFRKAVLSFSDANDIPWVKFEKDEAKLEVMEPHLARQAATGRSGVAAIGVAQEFQRVRTASEGKTSTGTPRWSFYKADRRVTCYYFYLWDAGFGPAFIKVCAWFPYPAKIWVNGHEWAKQQATRAGLGFTALPAGSPPARTRLRCRRSVTGSAPGPSTSSSSGGCTGCPCRSPPATMTPGTGGRPRCGRWRSPAPSSSTPPATPAASSRRWSPTTPASAGRTTWRSSSPARSAATPKGSSGPRPARRDNGGVLVNVSCKHSRIKQYLKDGRAMRIETAGGAPRDLGCNARLPNLDELQAKARAANRRILETERAGQGTSLRAQPLSGSRTPPQTRRGGGPRRCASAILGSRPWPAPYARRCSPQPASPARTCAS